MWNQFSEATPPQVKEVKMVSGHAVNFHQEDEQSRILK